MITAQEAQSLLEAKFPGVRKDGLTQIAGTLALMCETKEDAEKLINNMTDEAVNAQVKTMRSAIDAEVTKATKTHEDKLREKYSFVDKGQQQQQQQQQKQQQQEPDPSKQQDVATIVQQAIAPLMQKIEAQETKIHAYEQKGIKDARREKIVALLDGTPDVLRNAVLGQFDATTFADEDAFTTFLNNQTNDIQAYKTQVSSQLFGGFRPTTQQQAGGAVSQAVQSFIKSQQTQTSSSEGKKLI